MELLDHIVILFLILWEAVCATILCWGISTTGIELRLCSVIHGEATNVLESSEQLDWRVTLPAWCTTVILGFFSSSRGSPSLFWGSLYCQVSFSILPWFIPWVTAGRVYLLRKDARYAQFSTPWPSENNYSAFTLHWEFAYYTRSDNFTSEFSSHCPTSVSLLGPLLKSKWRRWRRRWWLSP